MLYNLMRNCTTVVDFHENLQPVADTIISSGGWFGLMAMTLITSIKL